MSHSWLNSSALSIHSKHKASRTTCPPPTLDLLCLAVPKCSRGAADAPSCVASQSLRCPWGPTTDLAVIRQSWPPWPAAPIHAASPTGSHSPHRRPSLATLATRPSAPPEHRRFHCARPPAARLPQARSARPRAHRRPGRLVSGTRTRRRWSSAHCETRATTLGAAASRSVGGEAVASGRRAMFPASREPAASSSGGRQGALRSSGGRQGAPRSSCGARGSRLPGLWGRSAPTDNRALVSPTSPPGVD